MYDRALLRDLLAQAQFEDVKIESRQVPITGASARTIATGQIRGTPRSLLIEKRGVELEDVIEKVTAALTKVGGDPYQGVTKSIVLPLSGANSPRTVEMLYNCPGQDFRAAMKTTAIQSACRFGLRYACGRTNRRRATRAGASRVVVRQPVTRPAPMTWLQGRGGER